MKRILIVEDEDILRSAYVTIFTQEKFNVAEAANGRLAIDQVKKHKPDLIILDVLMPGMSGIEFLEKTDIAKKQPNVKILVLSNLSDRDTVDRVTELGATKHMLKASMSPSQLVSTVKSLLQ
jgi:two-component system, response regulator, stage 0 sporulation protein F